MLRKSCGRPMLCPGIMMTCRDVSALSDNVSYGILRYYEPDRRPDSCYIITDVLLPAWALVIGTGQHTGWCLCISDLGLIWARGDFVRRRLEGGWAEHV